MKAILLRSWITSLFLIVFIGMHGQSFVLNGSATNLGGDCYQLTPDVSGQSGNIFSQTPIDLTQPFTISATFFFGCKDGNGADGIVFILATNNSILGTGGGGIGYQGITPSIAIEYDDYFNSEYGDPSPDHMAVISMGSVDHTLSSGLVTPVNLTNIENCEDHCFVADWNPVTQTLAATLDGNLISYSADIVNTIFSGNTMVYYGFSSGTGSLSNLHRVCFGPPALDPMPDETICEGESTTLEADEDGVAWTWAAHPTLSALNIQDPEATPLVTTTYTVTIEYACGYLQMDTVVVEVIPTPLADASNNGPLCEGDLLLLMASGGSSYQWSGPMGFSSGMQNPSRPNVTTGMSGIYTVTVTDASGCSATSTTEVVINTGPLIEIESVPDPVCINSDAFQMLATPAGGTWSGQIEPDGLFDPWGAGIGEFLIQYTVSNAEGCVSTAEMEVTVLDIPEILIDPPGLLCEESNAVQLTASPIGGSWEGEISPTGLFDPGAAGAGVHVITYTASDGNGCTNEDFIIVEVVAGEVAPILPPGPFCETESVVQLTADPPGGVWGGAADGAGQIFLSLLGAGMHAVTYTLTNQTGCYFGQADIEIIGTPQVMIDSLGPLCQSASIQSMMALPAGGTWSGVANATGEVDPGMLGSGVHPVIYTYMLMPGCAGVDTFDLTVLPAPPQPGNITYVCDSLNTTYTVVFSISGGDPLSYEISGSTGGTLLPGNPSIYTSMAIPSGNAYSFVVDDMHHCDPVTLSGDFTCNCATSAGSMDLGMITACEGDPIEVLLPTGVMLDPDDTLVYVLHSGNPDSAIFIGNEPVFAFGPPLQTGITYFISSMAGNVLAGMGVDPNDPCLSVSFGTPVRWEAAPSGYLMGPSYLCQGDKDTITFILEGTGPFDVSYTDGSNLFQLNGITSGYPLLVEPASTMIYTLTSVTLASPPGCSVMPDTAWTIDVIAPVTSMASAAICSGDSIWLEGSFQYEAGVYVDSLQSSSGCDSILETTLLIQPVDTVLLFDTSCDTNQTGIFYSTFSNQQGCDSTTVTTITYASSDTTHLSSTTCDDLMAGTFTTLLTGQQGCDSLVIESVLFIPPDTTYLSGETCDPDDAGSYIQVLMNEAGCDSVIIADVALLPADTVMIFQTSCQPQDTGFVTQVYSNVFGCDSLIWTWTTLAPFDSCHPPVIPKDIFIPNVFSPNGDGINDLFLVFAHPAAVEGISFVRIFDRWGGLVFEQTELQPNDALYGWDGTEKDKPLGPGVFVYVVHVRYRDGKEETLTGDITLIR